MTLTLLRHAQIEASFEGCYNGHNDISLSAQGRSQARALKQRLDTSSFDAIYCSDLRRTKETLDAFCHQQEVIYTKELREKSWGRHEGLSYEQIVTMEGQEYKNFDQWLAILDGEAYDLFIHRIKNFFFEFLPQQGDKNLLIVTHSGVIRILFHLLEKIPLKEAFSRKVNYASLTHIEITKEDLCD